MASDYKRDFGTIEDWRGRRVKVKADHGIVVIGDYEFGGEQFEELSHMLVQAAWQAAADSERMRQEASDD